MATLFTLVTGFHDGGDGRVYPSGTYALIQDDGTLVTTGSAVSAVPIESWHVAGDVQAALGGACRDASGDQQSPLVYVSSNF